VPPPGSGEAEGREPGGKTAGKWNDRSVRDRIHNAGYFDNITFAIPPRKGISE